MRVRLRDRVWEVEGVRAAGAEVFLDLRRADDRPGPLRLTVVPSLEPTLQLQQPQELRFEAGNPVKVNQLHDALALTMAHGRGDLVAVEHGRIDVEPYQLVPVLAAMRLPKARLLIADDVGLGKTIEAGLVLLELARRGRADRVLIACPAGLQDQWVEEMRFRFNLDFTKVDSRQWLELRRSYPASVSPWAAAPLAVSSIDYLKNHREALGAAPQFDVVIIDEAHHVARPYAGEGRTEATERSRLARLLADHSRELLLLSATPHNGYKESFASLLQLLAPHLARDDGRLEKRLVDPHVVRRLKDDVARGDPPQPISRRHPPQPIEVQPTTREKEIHQRLRGHSKRVLRALRDTDSYYVQAFALEVLRKRALSSPYALLQSLRRRAETLAESRGRLEAERAGRGRREALQDYRGDVALPEEDLFGVEEVALQGIAAHMADEDFKEEQRLVATLLGMVEELTAGDDSKLTRLRGWLEGFRAARRGERIIVFTEYRDTLDYLERHLGLGPLLRVDGTVPLAQRKETLERFAATPGAVLLATDAAGEGLNLQDACHVVVHYELPWNPNRMEQRNGRVDRYGQQQVVEISYLYLTDTRDEEILQRLREKLGAISEQLGSSSDVLGIAGRSEVIDGLLEDAAAEDLEARLERAARQVQEYLSRSGALALLRGWGDEQAAEEQASQAAERARWMLPDFEEFHRLVTQVVHESGGRVAGSDDLLTITPGPLLGQYPGVPAGAFEATFSRAVALAPENRGVAFLTSVHPLVRAVLQRVRTRLYDEQATDRVAVRPVAAEVGTGWLFTHIGRILTTEGRLVEEPLIPVFVPRLESGEAGPASRDATADLRRLRARAMATGADEAVGLAETRLKAGFAAAAQTAHAEAQRRLEERVAQLRTALADEADQLADELERWRRAELTEAEQRFAAPAGEGYQLGLFADTGRGAFRDLEEVQAAVNAEFEQRRQGLTAGYRLAEIPPADPVGCLLLVAVD